METLYKYLKIQNRPYSINDMVANLHNEFGKSAVQKAVDQLVKNNKLFEKVYGKQKVYCVVQNTEYDTEELLRINRELQSHVNEVESKYQDLQKEIKDQEAILMDLKSSITLEEAKNQKIELEESITILTHKLDHLIETVGNEDLTESKKIAQAALDEYSREYSKRKKLCTEILDCILENYPGSKNELYEEIGIEFKIVQ